MKKTLNISRGKDYWGSIINLKMFVNNDTYELPVNSSLKVDSQEENVKVGFQYLWGKNSVVLNKNEHDFNVNIKPFFSNQRLIIIMVSLFILFFAKYYLSLEWAGFAFKLLGISFLLTLAFLSTIGLRYSYRIEVNSLNK